MKNLKITIGSVLLVALFSNCENELSLEPETSYSENQIFSTEQGVETAVNGLYKLMSEQHYRGSTFCALLEPHSGKFYSNQGATSDATSLNCSPANTWIRRMWPQMYETINVANVIIDKLDNPETDLDNRERSLGQAHFMRGVAYFDLVRLFGDVPLRTVPSDAESLHLARTPKAQVYELIISDFEKAKQLLPDLGEYLPDRPAKYAANVYLAKVYMQLAGEDGGNPALWQSAYDEAVQVIGKYSLAPTYTELFDENNENTQESIFELQYGANGAQNNGQFVTFYTPSNSIYSPANIRTFGRVRPNKETFDEHVAQYPDDPRIDATFIYNSYPRNNGKEQDTYPVATSGNNGFPYIRKYLDSDYSGVTSRNQIVLRYADVLLMLAEIENELNGPENAYQYVNQVLQRARNTVDGATEPADWSGMDQAEFRDRILKERRYELLAEGHIWFDTRRRGYEYFLEEVVEKHNNHPTFDEKNDYVYPVSIKNMLLPIPSAEISGNQKITQADQNPGY